MIDINNFDTYSADLQKEVVDTLICFDRCSVVRSHGRYEVTTGSFLLGRYPEDFAVKDFHFSEILAGKDIQRRDHFKKTGEWTEREGTI